MVSQAHPQCGPCLAPPVSFPQAVPRYRARERLVHLYSDGLPPYRFGPQCCAGGACEFSIWGGHFWGADGPECSSETEPCYVVDHVREHVPLHPDVGTASTIPGTLSLSLNLMYETVEFLLKQLNSFCSCFLFILLQENLFRMCALRTHECSCRIAPRLFASGIGALGHSFTPRRGTDSRSSRWSASCFAARTLDLSGSCPRLGEPCRLSLFRFSRTAESSPYLLFPVF